MSEYRLRIYTFEEHSEFSFSSNEQRIDVSTSLSYDDISNIVRIYYGDTSEESLSHTREIESKISTKGSFKHHDAMGNLFLKALGEYVYQNLLPSEIIQALRGVPKNSILFLELNEGSTLIPWEHMYVVDNFLCLDHVIGRVNQNETPRPSAERNIQMLIVADPTGDLPETQIETNYIVNQLRGSNINITRYGTEITKDQYLRLLESGIFDIVHYSGHSASSMEKGKSHHLFSDGPLYGYEIEQISANKMPIMVFCNSCQSGESSITNEITGNTSLAGSYLNAGAGSSIGTIWSVSDRNSADISSNIYRYLLFGATIGEALLRAKRSSFQRWSFHDPAWISFILFGDPRIKLVQR